MTNAYMASPFGWFGWLSDSDGALALGWPRRSGLRRVGLALGARPGAWPGALPCRWWGFRRFSSPFRPASSRPKRPIDAALRPIEGLRAAAVSVPRFACTETAGGGMASAGGGATAASASLRLARLRRPALCRRGRRLVWDAFGLRSRSCCAGRSRGVRDVRTSGLVLRSRIREPGFTDAGSSWTIAALLDAAARLERIGS